MIGVDTNVLVRYLVQDDPVQSPLASSVFGKFTEEAPGFLSLVSLVETVWVLERVYKINKAAAMTMVAALTVSVEIVVERRDLVRKAARAASASGDFADAVIALAGIDGGCAATVTFDRKAADLSGMQLLH